MAFIDLDALAQFERESSNQILVAIYPRMQSASSVEDYTVRVAQAWRVGQKARNNGVVLFVFQESRDVRIVTGYGLEGVLPDAIAKRIISDDKDDVMPPPKSHLWRGDHLAHNVSQARVCGCLQRCYLVGNKRGTFEQQALTKSSSDYWVHNRLHQSPCCG